MDSLSEFAAALAVNDTDLENAFIPAEGEIMRQEIFHLPGLKAVQVQHAVNRKIKKPLFHGSAAEK